MQSIKLVITVFVLLAITACGDDTLQIKNPETYSFVRAGESTVSFSGQTTRIKMATELAEAMVELGTDKEELFEMFTNQTLDGSDANPFTDSELNVSTKSVRSKIAASTDYFDTNTVESTAIKATFDGWLTAHVEEVLLNSSEEAQRGTAGYIIDGTSTRYVSAKGLEYNQAHAKGLIGGLMVDQILNNYLSTAVLDAGTNVENNDTATAEEGKPYTSMEHKWDEAYGYLFGLSADASNPLATLGDDLFLNKYLKRVDDDSDFAGIASDIYEAFKLGRAAIVARDYETRDQQADIIKEAISKVVAIRAVHYLQQGRTGLVQTGPSGSVFHALSEGYGFVYSLRFTRKAGSSDSYFTRAEVETYIDQLEAQQGFWDVTIETLDSISADIAQKFDFTVAQAAE